MTFLIESVISCTLFAAFVTSSLLKNPLDWISDYTVQIQQRAKEIWLVLMDKKFIKKS